MKARTPQHAPAAGTTRRPREEDSSDVGVLAQSMGRRMGVDLSGVRIHTGDASAREADALDARAFTVGQDIHFAGGELDPGSRDGRKLLAHELVHTVQARGAAPVAATKSRVSSPGDAAEREADRLADALVDGSGPVEVREAPSAAVHREKKPKKRERTAGEPEIEVEPPEIVMGASGIQLTETPSGNLMHPLSRADAGGADVKKLNGDTSDLIYQQKSMDRQYLKLKHVASDYGGGGFWAEGVAIQDVMERKDYDVGAEIWDNLDNAGADQAKEITNVAMNVDVYLYLAKQASEALEDAKDRLHTARLRQAAQKDRARAKQLDAKIEKIKKGIEIVGDVSKAIINVALDPAEALHEAVDLLVDLNVELWGDVATDDLEREKEEAEFDAEQEEEEANESDEKVADRQVRNAKRNIRDLASSLEDARGKMDTRARNAEKVYDKRTKGSFKFADLRKHADRARDLADAADQAVDDARYLGRLADKVSADLTAALGHGMPFVPEVMEEYQTIAAMKQRAEKEASELKTEGSIYRMVQEDVNEKLAGLDHQLSLAAENHDTSAELSGPEPAKKGKKG